MSSKKDYRALDAIKSDRIKISKGLPAEFEGQDGDITVRQVPSGLCMYAKFFGKWYKVAKLEDITRDGGKYIGTAEDKTFGKLNIQNQLQFDKGTKTITLKMADDGETLKVRNADDSADAVIKAKTVQLTSDVSGTSGVAKGEIRYDASNESFTASSEGLLVSSALNGSSGDICSIVSSGYDADSQFRCMDGANSRWIFGNDYSDSHKFKIQNASALADSGEFALDVDGNLAVQGTLTSSAGVCGGPAVTNHITNNAADVMTVSDFGANPALKIDADQPATTASENSSGLQIDYDRAVATSGTGNHNDIGIDLDVNTATLGTGTTYGMDIDVQGATSGTHTVIGADITVSGADNNIGLIINSPSEHIRMQAAADAATDYGTISVADTGDMTIATFGDGTTDSIISLDADGHIILNPATNIHIADTTGILTISTTASTATTADLILDSGGNIELDAGNGVFVAKNAGTEFSAADSAYAGMILGYTCIGLDEAPATYNLTTSYVVPTDELQVTFTAPPSGKVEIEIQIGWDAGSSNAGDCFAGLSTANATSGYNRLQDYHEVELFDAMSRGALRVIRHSWTLIGLTAGTSYQYWVGFKTSSTIGTPHLQWGGNAAGEYPDFIMKATALPNTIST